MDYETDSFANNGGLLKQDIVRRITDRTNIHHHESPHLDYFPFPPAHFKHEYTYGRVENLSFPQQKMMMDSLYYNGRARYGYHTSWDRYRMNEFPRVQYHPEGINYEEGFNYCPYPNIHSQIRSMNCSDYDPQKEKPKARRKQYVSKGVQTDLSLHKQEEEYHISKVSFTPSDSSFSNGNSFHAKSEKENKPLNAQSRRISAFCEISDKIIYSKPKNNLCSSNILFRPSKDSEPGHANSCTKSKSSKNKYMERANEIIYAPVSNITFTPCQKKKRMRDHYEHESSKMRWASSRRSTPNSAQESRMQRSQDIFRKKRHY